MPLHECIIFIFILAIVEGAKVRQIGGRKLK